jgi:hypothetical protein
MGLAVTEIEIKLPDLSRVALEPGDVILVRWAGHMDEENARKLKMRLNEAFPGHKIAILPSGMELSVVRPVAGDEAAKPRAFTALAFAYSPDQPFPHEIHVTEPVPAGSRILVGGPGQAQQFAYVWRCSGRGPYLLELEREPGTQNWTRLTRAYPAGTPVKIEAVDD